MYMYKYIHTHTTPWPARMGLRSLNCNCWTFPFLEQQPKLTLGMGWCHMTDLLFLLHFILEFLSSSWWLIASPSLMTIISEYWFWTQKVESLDRWYIHVHHSVMHTCCGSIQYCCLTTISHKNLAMVRFYFGTPFDVTTIKFEGG